MTLEADQAIREELINSGYDPQLIDNIHKHIGCSYALIQQRGWDVTKFYTRENDRKITG